MSIPLKSIKLLSLDAKITLAENIIIEEYLRSNGNIFISFSGGKDSTILRHIALRLFPNLRCVFSNTTNELRDIVKYVKTFPNIITVTPELSYKKVLETKGFPLVSKEVSQKANELKHTNGKRTRMLRYYGNNKGDSKQSSKWYFLSEQQFDVSNKCCSILKKEPLQKWAKNNGNPKPLIALMSDESRLRSQLALYGKEDSEKIYPFLRTGWSEADIWEYANRYNIRFAECYYDRVINGVFIPKRDRSGCEFCGYDISTINERFETSRILSPKKYENIMNVKNNGITFREAKDIALNPPSNSLNLYGGNVTNVKVDEVNNKETFVYHISTFDKSCTACGCTGSSKIKRDIKVTSSFLDVPNPVTKQKRVIECHYWMNECSSCGMTLINDLHLFDLRFSVTKRLIDYIYTNLDKKSVDEVVNETGLPIEDVFEIIHFYYNKHIMEAYNNKRDSIWFDNSNNLIKVS